MALSMVFSLIESAVRAGTPLLAGTLGEIFAERSGILNLGMEGMMLMGAVSAFISAQITGNVWFGVLTAMLVGGMFSLIHGIVCITFRGNQYVSGISLSMLGSGISSLLGQNFIGIRGRSIKPVLFSFDPLMIFSIALVPCLWFMLFKTRYGIIIRSVGENPTAADAIGVNVNKIRYMCTFLGGLLSGLAGAYLSVAYIPSWTQNMTSGRGWIVIALTIFSSWDPRGALIGAWLFGCIEVIQYRLQPLGISPSLLGILPFFFTILILLIGTRTMRGQVPTALGKPFRRGER
jgi:simple sugar transport system permease protein